MAGGEAGSQVSCWGAVPRTRRQKDGRTCCPLFLFPSVALGKSAVLTRPRGLPSRTRNSDRTASPNSRVFQVEAESSATRPSPFSRLRGFECTAAPCNRRPLPFPNALPPAGGHPRSSAVTSCRCPPAPGTPTCSPSLRICRFWVFHVKRKARRVTFACGPSYRA